MSGKVIQLRTMTHLRNQETPDYAFDKHSANVLKQRVEAYWRKKGNPNVKAWVEEQPWGPTGTLYSVRSNIVFSFEMRE